MSTDPLPAQLYCMNTESVLRLLKLIRPMLKQRAQISKRTSRWVWGLLGRLHQVGTLGSEEVGIVRDLGKRAVHVGMSWKDEEVGRALARHSGEDENVEGENDADYENSPEMDVDDNHEDGSWEDWGEDEHGGFLQRADYGRQSAPVGDDLDPGPMDANHPALAAGEMKDADMAEPEARSSASHTHGEVHQGNYADLEQARIALLARLDQQPSKPQQEYQTPRLDQPTSSVTSPARMQDSTCDGRAMEGSASAAAAAVVTAAAVAEEHSKPDSNTLATLILIITIVGEEYGQRDLLEFRDFWRQDL